jgi:hypothetical protein
VKTLQRRIRQAANEARVSQPVIERDYAESYVLLGVARRADLIHGFEPLRTACIHSIAGRVL